MRWRKNKKHNVNCILSKNPARVLFSHFTIEEQIKVVVIGKIEIYSLITLIECAMSIRIKSVKSRMRSTQVIYKIYHYIFI